MVPDSGAIFRLQGAAGFTDICDKSARTAVCGGN